MDSVLPVLVLDPNATCRQRLNSFLEAENRVGEVVLSDAPQRALQRLSQGERFDLILIGERVPRDCALLFIDRIRRDIPTMDAALMLVASQPPDPRVHTAELISKVDGFLLEPFSREAVADAVVTAEGVRRKRRDLRMKVMLKVLCDGLKAHVAELAELLADECRGRRRLALLRQLRDILSDLSEEHRPEYMDLLIQALLKRPAHESVHEELQEVLRPQEQRAARPVMSFRFGAPLRAFGAA